MSESWNATFGPGGPGGVAVLEKDWVFAQMSNSAADAQQLETRQFQIEEVARIFRVYPQMLMLSGKTSSYASVEQFFLAHVTHTLMPWIQRWEQAIQRDILGRDSNFYVKFNANAMMRGTSAARAEFYREGITNGWLTRNEVRKYEDLDPIPGLDVPIMPLNMAEVGKAEDGK
ncbi:MAG: hypothetical protein DSY80_10460 [Desulfocapsa sp.]|nr:MAG: hypothetical protein DSY80_10460 [Desulfocapsa sp.]